MKQHALKCNHGNSASYPMRSAKLVFAAFCDRECCFSHRHLFLILLVLVEWNVTAVLILKMMQTVFTVNIDVPVIITCVIFAILDFSDAVCWGGGLFFLVPFRQFYIGLMLCFDGLHIGQNT